MFFPGLFSKRNASKTEIATTLLSVAAGPQNQRWQNKNNHKTTTATATATTLITTQQDRTWCSFAAGAALPPHSSVNLVRLVMTSSCPAVRDALRFIPTLCPLFF